MSAAEARMHALAQQALSGDEMERRLALSILLEIALAVARAEDKGQFISRAERPRLELVEDSDA